MVNFGEIKHKNKLFAGFILSAILTVAVGSVGVISSARISRSFERLESGVIRDLTQLEKIRSSFSLMLLEMTTFLVLSPVSTNGNPEQIEKINSYKNSLTAELEKYNKERARANAVGEKLNIDLKNTTSLVEQIVDLSLQKKSIEEILPFKKELKGLEERSVFPEIQKNIDKLAIRLAEERRQNDKTLNTAFFTIIITSGIGVFLILFLGFQISKRELETDRLVAQLISIASHQLKTPLTIIMGHSELLLESRLNSSAKENIQIIRETANNMEKLVRDILDLTKIDQGKFVIKKDAVDVVAVINEIIRTLETETKENKVMILFKKPDKKILANTDELKIAQALRNIIDNGIKYNKTGGELEIEVKRAGEFISISIKDEGIGIPKKEAKMIFERFFRASNAAQKKHLGTGLGLFIARAIIEQSGGELAFKSEEGSGTTFNIKLRASANKT